MLAPDQVASESSSSLLCLLCDSGMFCRRMGLWTDSYQRSRTHAANAPASAQLRLHKASGLANQQDNCCRVVRLHAWTTAFCWDFVLVVIGFAVYLCWYLEKSDVGCGGFYGLCEFISIISRVISRV